VRGLLHALPTGYNRDLQETKEPLLRGLRETIDMVLVMALTIERLSVHADRLRAALSAELFATDAAYELVRRGESFRDAYKTVAGAIEEVAVPPFADALGARQSTGAPGNLNLNAPRRRLEDARNRLAERVARLEKAAAALVPEALPLYPTTDGDAALLSRESLREG
jgi:argininosuccinate lyase